MTIRKGDVWNVVLSLVVVLWLPIKDAIQAFIDGQSNPNFSVETWVYSAITSVLGAVFLWYQSRKSTDNDEPVVTLGGKK